MWLERTLERYGKIGAGRIYFTRGEYSAMKKICDKRCNIGEGPIWNDKEGLLYFVNGFENEICTLDILTGESKTRKVDIGAAAIAFTKDYRMIVSRRDGVFILNDDDTTEPLYDTEKYSIKYANDMKVGPDGRIYVGTQCSKRLGISDEINGKLYSIDRDGNVRILLDGLILSNGLDWSPCGNRFYHTDSGASLIREYDFNKESGDIVFTGRQVPVRGADGFTVSKDGYIYAVSWGNYCVLVIDTKTMEPVSRIDVPAKAPASCGFAGADMQSLVVTTASYGVDINKNPDAGFIFSEKRSIGGVKPYLF